MLLSFIISEKYLRYHTKNISITCYLGHKIIFFQLSVHVHSYNHTYKPAYLLKENKRWCRYRIHKNALGKLKGDMHECNIA